MKKILLLAALAAITATTASAQWNLRYQGDVQLGYAMGTGDNFDRVNVHTVHGMRFNDYLFAGLGTGVDIYLGIPYANADLTSADSYGEKTKLALPLFVDLKGYLPVAPRLDLFAALDIGYSIALSKKDTVGMDLSGFLCAPQVGIAYKLNNGNALTFAFGFAINSTKASVYVLGEEPFSERGNNNAISLKLGFQF